MPLRGSRSECQLGHDGSFCVLERHVPHDDGREAAELKGRFGGVEREEPAEAMMGVTDDQERSV
jgi:hypothetical protein